MVHADKNPLAVALGRMAAAKLTPAQRSKKARKAAKARWGRHNAMRKPPK